MKNETRASTWALSHPVSMMWLRWHVITEGDLKEPLMGCTVHVVKVKGRTRRVAPFGTKTASKLRTCPPLLANLPGPTTAPDVYLCLFTLLSTSYRVFRFNIDHRRWPEPATLRRAPFWAVVSCCEWCHGYEGTLVHAVRSTHIFISDYFIHVNYFYSFMWVQINPL